MKGRGEEKPRKGDGEGEYDQSTLYTCIEMSDFVQLMHPNKNVKNTIQY
jgi:hypothetical protein